MNREIERKFLVKNMNFLKEKPMYVNLIVQGYLSKTDGRTVRVRSVTSTRNGGLKGYITIKLKEPYDSEAGVDEYEYEIPAFEAAFILEGCIQPLITKTRHVIQYKNTLWEVDIFSGHTEGLILAEVELKNIDDHIDLPEWIGEEVTNNPIYSNAKM